MNQRKFPEWQPIYSVGNYELDNQHKKILSLCRQSIDGIDDVMAFVDIDPSGLLIANSFDNLVAVIAPSAHVLAEQLASPATGRRDLFVQQYPGASMSLDRLQDSSPVFPLWELVLEHRAGVVQERWVGAEITCQPWYPLARINCY